jgi:hypothetical protein
VIQSLKLLAHKLNRIGRSELLAHLPASIPDGQTTRASDTTPRSSERAGELGEDRQADFEGPANPGRSTPAAIAMRDDRYDRASAETRAAGSVLPLRRFEHRVLESEGAARGHTRAVWWG